MTRIFKYEIGQEKIFDIFMHKGAVIRAAEKQNSKAYLWAEIDEAQELVPRTFAWFATGEKISVPEKNRSYVGTFMFQDGELVYHLYELFNDVAN